MHRFVTAVAATCVGCFVAAGAQSSAPDLVLTNGHIFTGTPGKLWVDAIAIRGDRVVAVGTDAEIRAKADGHTKTIDLAGRMAMPGINDAHDHVGGAPFGVEIRFPPVQTAYGPGPNPSIRDMADAVRSAAVSASGGQWLHARVGEAVIRNPKEARAALDRAAGDHPVEVESWWGHGILLNARGLAKIGLTDGVTDPGGGHFDRDDAGHLTGLCEEEAGNEIRRRLTDEAGVEPSIREFRNYTERRLQQGVTSIQVMATNQRLSYLEKTFAQADEPLRVRIIRFPMAREDARTGETLGTGEQILTPRVRVSGVKFVLDGTPIEELAYQTRDYTDRPGWRGRPDYSPEFIGKQLRLALNGKDQLMMHIVGDAMTDQVLDQMEKLAPAERWRPLRVRVEHGDGFTTPERMARAKKLGIVIAQPRPGRPWKALESAGIPLAYGSDAGMTPWLMFSVMTDAKNPQAISKEDALRILTSGPAFAEFEETEKGTLGPGMLADVTVLSQDVVERPVAPLPSTRSVLTIVGGSVVYRSAEMMDRN